MTDDAATPGRLAIACSACRALAGEPCRWGHALTSLWGDDADRHVHFARSSLTA